jgi:hypothetical protein
MKLSILMTTSYVFAALTTAKSFQLSSPSARSSHASPLHLFRDDSEPSSRRSFLVVGSATLLSFPLVANAGIDPSLLKSMPVQGDESGSAQRLRQVEAIQRPATDLVQMPFEDLPSGVSYREYREGKGEAGRYKQCEDVGL